ncbi:MAG: 16S rRNA (cytosine(967)-C(5))-methyltransferase RsmB [Burkholderiales bacterium]|nr:16S rRNA (cytosine(967)-C(5))-methyltransferase RsmB [Burkholderiales bacterium]
MWTPQRLAADAIHQVLRGRSLTPTLEGVLARAPRLSASERGALWDISHGSLRHLGLLQALLARMLRKPLAEPWLEALLVAALYRMEFTQAPAYATVSQAVDACAAAGFPWAKGMVNAVLRRFQRERPALLALARSEPRGRFSYPDWWIERVRCDYPDTWQALLEAGNRRPGMALRINLRRTPPQAYLAALEAAGLTGRREGDAGVILERVLPVARLPGFAEGLVSVQDIGAQLAAPLLDLAAGQRVLDAFAAPGGKAAHILESADVELLALDSDADRLGRVGDNLQRLGLRAALRCADACALSQWWDGRGFDRVLADVPCTASGVVRRHPDIKWLRREHDLAALAAQAGGLLDALWRVVVPGGKLLLATCSVFRPENRAQVDAFVGRHTDARLVPLPGREAPEVQLLPDESHDGFYYALFERLG